MGYPITRIPRGIVAGGRPGGASLCGAVFVLRASFDPTSATQVLLGTLPNGARVIEVVSEGGATGGTNPTVDIGTLADDDGLANELAANIASSATSANKIGAQFGTKLTAETAVYGKVGASAGTGGTTTVQVHFIVEAT